MFGRSRLGVSPLRRASQAITLAMAHRLAARDACTTVRLWFRVAIEAAGVVAARDGVATLPRWSRQADTSYQRHLLLRLDHQTIEARAMPYGCYPTHFVQARTGECAEAVSAHGVTVVPRTSRLGCNRTAWDATGMKNPAVAGFFWFRGTVWDVLKPVYGRSWTRIAGCKAMCRAISSLTH